MDDQEILINGYQVEATRLIDEIEVELTKPEVDSGKLELSLACLDSVLTVYKEEHQKFISLAVSEKPSKVGSFLVQQSVFNLKVEKIRKLCKEAKAKVEKANHAQDDGYDELKLQKVVVEKFDGDLNNWLAWWGSFEIIHQSNKSNKLKFDHLIDSLKPGSLAMEAIKGMSRTAENYPKAVAVLEKIFGNKDDILNALTTRINELLTAKDNLSFPERYFKLLTKIQELESLGVKPMGEEASPLLYGPVINLLKEDRKLAWKRHYEALDDATRKGSSKLRLLFDWLLEEVVHVKSEEALSERKRERVVTLEDIMPSTAHLVQVNSPAKRRKIDYRKYCLFCDKNHGTMECFKAGKTMSLEERRRKLQQYQLCYICFRDNHRSYECKEQIRCKGCNGQHYPVMCNKSEPRSAKRRVTTYQWKASNEAGGKLDQRGDTGTGGEGSRAAMLKSVVTVPTAIKPTTEEPKERQVPLQTLITRVSSNSYRNSMTVRTLLDSGAQRSTILSQVAAALKLKPKRQINLVHMVYGGEEVLRHHHVYDIVVSSLDGDFRILCEVIDEDKIVERVPSMLRFKSSVPSQVMLTDVNSESEIQLLLGNDYYGQLITGDEKALAGGIIAINTKLGWVLSGTHHDDDCESTILLHTVSLLNTSDIKHLWELDSLGIKDPIQVKSQKEIDEETKAHFMRTVTKNAEGRYEIELPWVRPKEKIACNFTQARQRLESATRKLVQQNLVEPYDKVFQEWKDMKIIEEIPLSVSNMSSGYFLPHRAVVKESSETTKIRPVFDASSKTATGMSLNDCLAKGPNLIELIPDIIIRFRLRPVAAVSDIGKAFLQIAVCDQDCQFLKFLWWERDWTTLKMYRHRRVVFGVNSSPFELAAVIEKHLTAVKGAKETTARLLRSNLYVDNAVVSLDTTDELEKFKREAIAIMAEAKMDLRMWKTNAEEFDDSDRTVSVLGIDWDRRVDTLKPKINAINLPAKLTKRVILAIAQSVFDPMGMYAPVLIRPKLVLRKLHEQKLGWDDEVPEEFAKEFTKECAELEALNAMQVPRRLCAGNNFDRVQIHVFGDASKDAYAAAVYSRITVGESHHVQLIMAKSRVAPQKATIPRLELLAATIAARLGSNVLRALSKGDVKAEIRFWSDAKTVLTWIRQDHNNGAFINNRVAEIRQLTSVKNWHFVPGVLNPADLPSRGCTASKLAHSDWLSGPAWLSLPETSWPQESAEPDVAIETVIAVDAIGEPWYQKYPEFEKNVRHVAYTLRTEASSKALTVDELENAEFMLWQYLQRDHGVKEHMGRLTLKQNKRGLFCVQTRLECSAELNELKAPIFLPPKSVLVAQYIMREHLKFGHAPEGVMIVKLRKSFWIPGVRMLVRNTIKKCMSCRRYTARSVQVPTAPLPTERLLAERCFENTGVDLGGPLILRDGQKVWFVLFTCAVFRAVHLELVTSLSTAGFIMALRRFISRRSRPHTIFSDCGTNFVGLENLMAEVNWEEIEEQTTVDRIRWKFNPPTSPWWGGWWERLVGVVKLLIKKNLGGSVVNFEELLTIMCEIESVVNSRPLTRNLTSLHDEAATLTPQMFLSLAAEERNVEIDVNPMPDLDQVEAKQLNKQFAARKALMKELRQRFVNEYLANLVEHYKKVTPVEVKVGDIVLIGSDDTARVHWPLAKVIECVKGKDGVVRLLRLQAKIGNKMKEVMRPVQRVYPLELDTAVTEGVDLNEILGFSEPPLAEAGTEPETTAVAEPLDPPPEERKEVEVTTRSGRVSRKPRRLIEDISLVNGIRVICDD